MSVSNAEQRRPAPFGDLDQRAGELAGRLERRQERARPGLDVHDQGIEAGRQLLRQDRGDDQRNRFHRRGDVADGVEAAVGRRQIVGLADDRAARGADGRAQALEIGLGRVTGNAVQLVQRAAGMAQAAARDHRHIRAARRHHRRQHQAHLVADAAGRMLVEHGAVQIAPGEAGRRIRSWRG